jgi:organic radical activating enzyme
MEWIDPKVHVPTYRIASDRVNWAVNNIPKFCVLPWLNLHTSPNGEVKLCCSIQSHSSLVMDTENKIERPFNFGYDDITTIWNSDYMANSRDSHRSGQGFYACDECYISEERTAHSPRMGQNTEWLHRQETDLEIQTKMESCTTNGDAARLDHLPISLELRLGNQCNLQCITCWPMSSSLIHDERKNILAKSKQDEDPITTEILQQWNREVNDVDSTDLREWYDTDQFYVNMKAIAPGLKRLYTTGGEPTLIKANYKVLQLLLDADNTGCKIEFTSNMKTWNSAFYDRLEQFDNVEVQMSIDGLDEIGEFIRYPTKMVEFYQNVDKLLAMAASKDNWSIKVYTVLQACNYNKLYPLWEYLMTKAHRYGININWWPITLYMPKHLSLQCVPKQKRLDYVSIIQDNVKRINDQSDIEYFWISEDTEQAYVESLINHDYDDYQNKKLFKYLEAMDQSRGTNGVELFRDLRNE